MKFDTIIPSNDRGKGPLPLRATIDAELRDHQEQLASYQIQSSLASKAILPLYLELHTPIVGDENFPEMFARAYGAESAPLYQDKARPGEQHPGLLCWLPTPLKMGIQAVGIRQWSPKHQYVADLSWDLARIDLLATQPTSIVEQLPAQAFSWITPIDAFTQQPADPRTRLHLSGVGELVPTIPRYTPDDELQKRIEESITQRLEAAPQSTDKCKELVPGILSILQQDGIMLRESTDWLVGYDFAVVANYLGLSHGAGKGVYTRLLRHLGNQELSLLQRQGLSQNKLEKRTLRLYGAIQHMSYRTGTDMLFDVQGRRYSYQVGLGREEARPIALAIISGELKLQGIGSAGIEILRHVFDVPDL